MKYNLSQIMKRAWEIKRENRDNVFAICLSIAWEEARNMKEKEIFNKEVIFNEYKFKLWEEKYTKYRRITIFDFDNRYCGYIDVELKNRICITRKDHWAEGLAEKFLETYDIDDIINKNEILEGTDRQVKKAVEIRKRYKSTMTKFIGNTAKKYGKTISELKTMEEMSQMFKAYNMALSQKKASFWLENNYEDLDNETYADRKISKTITEKFM